jgi:hypothetical protein
MAPIRLGHVGYPHQPDSRPRWADRRVGGGVGGHLAEEAGRGAGPRACRPARRDAGSQASLQVVASATEEMAATANEIARNANEATNTVTAAVGVVESAGQTMTRPGEASVQISDIVQTITSVTPRAAPRTSPPSSPPTTCETQMLRSSHLSGPLAGQCWLSGDQAAFSALALIASNRSLTAVLISCSISAAGSGQSRSNPSVADTSLVPSGRSAIA